MVIRKALKKDAKSIIEINIKCWQETYGEIFPDSFLSSLSEKKEESVTKCKNKINEYVVCELDNNVVGFIRYGKNKKEYSNEYGEVYALYVNSKYQKKGIGKELLDFAFNELKETYKFVLISTLVQNTANEFYKKCGGEQIDNCIFKLLDNEYEENLYLFKI